MDLGEGGGVIISVGAWQTSSSSSSLLWLGVVLLFSERGGLSALFVGRIFVKRLL
jgi:hypothetical protein